MNKKLFNVIKCNFETKTTEELLNIWQQNDRSDYSDEAFEAIKVILAGRNTTIPAQQEYVPNLLSDEPKWTIGKIKKMRKLYLVLFILMIIAQPILLGSSEVFLRACGLLVSIGFLITFLSVAREACDYPIFVLVIVTVGLFIPIAGILILLFVDRSIYGAIKEKEATFNSEDTILNS